MRKWALLLIILCPWGFGSEVVKYNAAGKTAYITQSKKRPWKEEDKVCLFRQEKGTACGIIVKSTPNFAKIRFTDAKADVRKGDQVHLVMLRAPASETSATTLTKRERKEVAYNTLVGVNMAADRVFPKIEFQGLITPKVALGIQPAFARAVTFDEAFKLTSYGVMFTWNYYFADSYRGFWIQGASGLYLITENTTGTSVQRDVPALALSIGWRETWALGLNIGLAIGARYIAFPELSVKELQFKQLQPSAVVDIGFCF